MTADPFQWPEDQRITDLRTQLAATYAALAAITQACDAAVAEHRINTPTFGLVSAARIAAIAKKATP